MDIQSSRKLPKQPVTKAKSDDSRAEFQQSLKQHMQEVLLEGKVSDFFQKSYYEDDFLALNGVYEGNDSLSGKVTNFLTLKAKDFNYYGHSEGVKRAFQDFTPGRPDPNFQPLSAERFVDELNHQQERYEITGNSHRSGIFRDAAETLKGRTGMSLHDALKELSATDEAIDRINRAVEMKPKTISNESVAVGELRQNVEILELKVQQAAKAEGPEAAEMSPERAALREELQQARQDLALARKDPQQAEELFSALNREKAAQGVTITAAERAAQSPDKEVYPARRPVGGAPIKDALSHAGQMTALGAGFAVLGTTLAGMAATPVAGGIMNSAFLGESDTFMPAAIGVAANAIGSLALLKGDLSIAIPSLAISSACYLGSGHIYHRYR